VCSKVRRRTYAVILLFALAVSLALLARILWPEGMIFAGAFGSFAAFVLAFLAISVPIVVRLWRDPYAVPPSAKVTPEQAADQLVTIQRGTWQRMEEDWGVGTPGEMQVRWEVTRNTSAGADRPEALVGRFDNVYEAFAQANSNRLAILGPAGSGKTVIATELAIQIVASRSRGGHPGIPVPVVVPATSWKADGYRRLSDWIADQLIMSHGWLAERVAKDEALSLAEVLSREYVIPIIDGLDELTAPMRVSLIQTIRASNSRLPLVLTSRPAEYESAVAMAGVISPITEARLVPLSGEDIEHYLEEAAPASWWAPVFDGLAGDGPLANVLANPLMLWLARRIYQPGRADPGDLAGSRFMHQGVLERHLISGYVPAVYDRQTGISRFRCGPRRAQRWLSFLASSSDSGQAASLEWWRLPRAVRLWWPLGFAARVALLFAGTWYLVSSLLGRYPTFRSLLSSGILGRRLIQVVNYVTRRTPRQAYDVMRSDAHAVVNFLSLHSLAAFEFWAVGGALILGALIAPGFAGGSAPRVFKIRVSGSRLVSLLVSYIFVLGPVALLWWLVPEILARQNNVAQLRQIRQAWYHMSSSRLLLLIIVLWLLTGITNLGGVTLDRTRAITPDKVMRADRATALLTAIPAKAFRGVLAWMVFGPTVALAYALYCIMLGCCRVSLGGSGTASSEFTSARIWLALTRRMPWRALSFLNDACQTGVLRQVGAVYQFRHVRLQEQLSEDAYRSWPGRLITLGSLHVPRLMERLDGWWWWRWRRHWWSTAPWSVPLWARRFQDYADGSGGELGEPAGAVSIVGRCATQPFVGDGGASVWMLYSFPSRWPMAVALPIWRAVEQAGIAAPNGAHTALGFPVGIDARDERSIVRAQASRVELRGGSWGPGVLLRDGAQGAWRWQAEPGFNPYVQEWKYLPSKWARSVQLRFHAHAGIPLATSRLELSAATLEGISTSSAFRDLAPALARPLLPGSEQVAVGRWAEDRSERPLELRRFSIAVTGPDSRRVATAELGLSVTATAESPTTLVASVDLRTEDIGAWHGAQPGSSPLNERKQRISLEEFVDLVTTAWQAVTETLPDLIVGDDGGARIAGPAPATLLISASMPIDLLLDGRIRAHLGPRRYIAVVMSLVFGRTWAWRKPGDLEFFIDFGPFRAETRADRLSVEIAGPLRIDPLIRKERARQAIAVMLSHNKFETEDVRWSAVSDEADTIKHSRWSAEFLYDL
jgi:hypothetical protein